jgi:hypothetical protein
LVSTRDLLTGFVVAEGLRLRARLLAETLFLEVNAPHDNRDHFAGRYSWQNFGVEHGPQSPHIDVLVLPGRSHMTPLALQIREQVGRYLAGQDSLRDFTEWFLAASWDVQRRDPGASDLVYAVELHLENYSDWGDEAELRRALNGLVRTQTLHDPTPAEAAPRTSSATNMLRRYGQRIAASPSAAALHWTSAPTATLQGYGLAAFARGA